MASVSQQNRYRPAASDEILLRERRRRNRLFSIIGIVSAAILVCFYQTGLLDLVRLAEGFPAIGVLFSEMVPPSFENWQDWVTPLIDTLAMSVAGTAMAVVLSLPLGFLAARNVSPHPVVYQAARTFLNAARAIPELIMGIVFVAAVGFGAMPGVLALGLHSVGMVGKFFSEAIEHAHDAPIEAARAAGGSPIQIVTHGILPQVIPQFADVTMYRWEYNFRASTVMGMVGAGGIGLELMGSLRLMQYTEVLAILLVILVMVTIVDGLSSLLRKTFK